MKPRVAVIANRRVVKGEDFRERAVRHARAGKPPAQYAE